MSKLSDEEIVFNNARKIEDPEAQAQYVSEACDGDAELQVRVKKLIESQRVESQFLEAPALPPTWASNEQAENPGTQIGRYKLLQEIGTGGFGVVYMAEQTQPVRRKVALKIIKAGMDTKEVVGRFEAERQALALMDHPNIAQVHDGGATENGRPYFVMELVKGVPITEFCDKNKFSTEQRLQLFIDVCRAVQHAHQKGIIHRDLKPSNVLVTLADHKPIVKVIDFGVAKAMNQQLTEQTLFTAFGQMIGTPQYMSPEQAEFNCLDVDTRSDVYSLGVLLYELLTGATPLAAERLRSAGYAEMQRLIREEEPPKPSNRLSISGELLTAIAGKRCVSAKELMSQVSGDLDWIVMKTLEKDRNRRYGSASSLADDVLNYIDHEPVVARPPTVRYRLGKYLRRHRMASLLVCSMAFGLVGTFWQTTVAWQRLEENQQQAVEIESQKQQLLEEAKTQTTLYALQGDLETARSKLQLATVLGAEAGWCKLREGQIALQAAEYDEARALLQEATEQLPESTAAYSLRLICEYFSGYEHSYLMQVGHLKNRPASEFEDYLFRGLAQTWAHPRRAVDDLRKAVDDQPNHAIVHLVLASALRLLAADTSDTNVAYEVAKQAIGEAFVAKKLLPDNAFAMTEFIHGHIVLANACEDLGTEYDLEKHASVATARNAVNESRSIEPYNSMLHRARVYFYDQYGEPGEEAAELLANVPDTLGQLEEHSDIVFRRAWIHFRNNNLGEAQQELDSMDGLFARAYLIPQALIDASQKDLVDLQSKYQELLTEPDRDKRGIFAHHDWAIARLLLLEDVATQKGKRFHELATTLDHDYTEGFIPLAKYMSGDPVVNPDDILTGRAMSNRLLAENLFLLGVDALANGDRAEAKHYFKDCLETDYYEFFVYWWSQAFLEKLKDDEQWLPWLPRHSDD